MSSEAPKRKPFVLRMLAAAGLLLGSFGGMYSFSDAVLLLSPRHEFVAKYREVTQQHFPPPTGVDADEYGKQLERVADAHWARRGAGLPLDGIGLILSVLLVSSCLRALRGVKAGLQAWRVAALASVPYYLLDALHLSLEARDVAAILGAAVEPRIERVLVRMCLMVTFSAVCLAYLRRPQLEAYYNN